MLGLARLMRLASIAICLIVVASFVVFAVDQTSNASNHQQEQLSGTPVHNGASPAASTSSGAPRRAQPHARTRAACTSAIDDVSNQLTSPFSGLLSSSSSEWAIRGVKLLFALLVYGFGLGYLARVIRVRA